MDPGLAFGTGNPRIHRALSRVLDGARLAGRRVIDYGCGSACLRSLRSARGAHAQAVDIDEQALLRERGECRRERRRRPHAICQTASIAAPADVVIANILPPR